MVLDGDERGVNRMQNNLFRNTQSIAWQRRTNLCTMQLQDFIEVDQVAE
jgi:hypothetical protein